MKRHRILYVGVTGLWVVAMAVVVKVGLDRLPVSPWGNPAGDELSPAVAEDTQVGEAFVAPLPGLYRIDLVLESIEPDGEGLLVLHLKADPSAKKDLWTGDVHVGGMQPGIFYTFEFPPIRDSEGKSYYFYLEPDDPAGGGAVAARYSSLALLQGSSAYVNGRPVAGNLQFQTHYTLRTRDRIGVLLSRMAEGRPYMLGTKGFYVGLGIVYVLILGALLLMVTRAILREEEGES
jgi:hypothetical protein